ncbi:Calcium/proton exchanger [Microthyrium microscopicum]|uniref:Vacuolar calcium ion transporter n=1 Tax=Microthyrium microscopicum TaxID=703497 RepID=A0A6A6UQF5_9PEZI|nr:Calcium/proton exchanger [Microthyrium microscopicum]
MEHRKNSFQRRADVEAQSESTPLLNGGSARADPGESQATLWGDDDPRPWASYPKTALHLTWKVLASNYVNVLLVFVPAGIICGILKLDPTVVFAVNFIAIIPLAALLSFATEELSASVGQTIGGLLNASFGNAVELIVSIFALLRGEIRIVQASMLGSILSNVLLVLGCCFVSAGFRGGQQDFNATAATTLGSLLAVSSASLVIPAALAASITKSSVSSIDAILVISRGTSIILLILYGLYLLFQLKTHKDIFDGEQEVENEEERTLKPIPAVVTLLLITILVSFCADYLVDSIDDVVSSTGMSRTFIGLILLPIVGNAAEHVTAAVVAYKGKMDLAIGVAIGSSLQIAIFVTPFLVILGWIIGQDMTLNFHGFETVVFFISILVVNYLIQDGKSNYLEGAMCIGTYAIIAIAFFVYPDDSNDIGSVVKRFFDPRA